MSTRKLNPSRLLEWRYLPLLLVVALSAGITVGLFSYKASDTNVQLAPELCGLPDVKYAEAPPSSLPGAPGVTETALVPEPPSHAVPNSYQIAVADPVGIRLKTIVSR